MRQVIRKGHTLIAICNFNIFIGMEKILIKKGDRIKIVGDTTQRYGYVSVNHNGNTIGFNSYNVMIINDKLVKLQNKLEVGKNGICGSNEEHCL